MRLFGRIAQSSGASRQVEATANSYRAAETLIHQQVHPDELLLFVWATTGRTPAGDASAADARPRPSARLEDAPTSHYR